MPKKPTDNKLFYKLERYIDQHTAPSLPSVNEISKDIGINVPTLTRWLRILGWEFEQGRWIKVRE